MKPIRFRTRRTKKLAKVTAKDIPPGLDAEDVATDCQGTHSFTIILKGLNDLTEELANRIFEAGCDDCTLSMHAGIVRADFDREAKSMAEAVKSAMAQLKKAGRACKQFVPELEK